MLAHIKTTANTLFGHVSMLNSTYIVSYKSSTGERTTKFFHNDIDFRLWLKTNHLHLDNVHFLDI